MASDLSAVTGLVNEIHWLSAELKKRTALRSEQERVLLASKGLLHTLAEHGPCTVPAIAEARNTSRQNIQIIANRLAELGCVEFVPNPHHKKSDLVRLTASGAALLKSSVRQETAILNSIATQIDAAQATALLEPLHQLRALLEDGREARQRFIPAPHAVAASGAAQSQNKDASEVQQTSEISVHQDEPTGSDSFPVNLL